MEFRKIYIRRLLPVLGIILVLVLTIIGHEALKAQAQVADTKEELRKIQNDTGKIDETALKEELTDEVKAAVERVFDEKMKTVNLVDYFTDEDWDSFYEKVESTILLSEAFGKDEKTLSEEQKGVVNSLISEALTLYSQMNVSAELSDEAREEINELVEELIKKEIEGFRAGLENDTPIVNGDLVMTDEEKEKLVKEISEKVQHDILAYITEHIQLIYGGDENETQKELICDTEEHVHGDDCYTRELICDLEEDETHTHSDECYEYDTICDKEEHIHSEECYKTVEDEGGAVGGSTPCVHMHVDYLLTDEDRSEIVKDIINGTDLAEVLSLVFYQEIEKTMTDIVKEKMYEAVLDSLSERLDEIITESLEGFEQRLLEVENLVLDFGRELGALSGEVASLEKGSQTVRFNDITGMIECYSGGVWKPFMSASSIWVSQGLLYSAGKKSDNFAGFKGFAIATPTINYSETGSALMFYSNVGYTPGVTATNVYTTDQTKPFEYTAQYNTLRIDYGMVATSTYVSRRKSNGTTEKCYYYHTPTLTIQVIDFTTKDVYSTGTAKGTSSSLTQGVMELPLPNNPYYIKATYQYTLSGTSHSEASGNGTSGYAYIYSMQCVKK